MNEEELAKVFHRTDLFDEISQLSDCVFRLLDLTEEEMVTLESFFGEALDKTYSEGVSAGMAAIILEDLFW